jgi:hypothetical protein
MGYRNYSTAKGHIVDANGSGDFTTISAAIAAAVSGQTIFVRTGIYTENPTLKGGVDIAAFDCDAFTPNVTIKGTCTFSGAGTVSITGIQLLTNSAFFLVVSGSSPSVVNLTNCYLNCLNNTGINLTSSSGSSVVTVMECQGNIAIGGITLFTMSGQAGLNINYSTILNGGTSTVASTLSSGVFGAAYSQLFFPIQASSTSGFTLTNCKFDIANLNTTVITTSGTSAFSIISSYLSSGAASTINIGSGTTLNVVGSCTLASSNTNVITGAGTLVYTPINFMGPSSAVNTTIQNPKTIGPTILNPSQPCFLALANAVVSNVTGDGTNYQPIFNTTVYDQASNYNTGTGNFTAPYTGKYLFYVNLVMQGATAADSATGQIVCSSRTFTAYNSGVAIVGNNTITMTAIADMTAGDTAGVRIQFSGSTKSVSIFGDATGNPRTYFTGHLVC